MKQEKTTENKLKEVFNMEKDNIDCLNENYWFGTKKADYWHNKEVNFAFRKGLEQGRKEAIEDVLKLIKLCSLSELRSQLENYLKEN